MNTIEENSILKFENQLCLNERAKTTVNKYSGAVRKLAKYLDGAELDKNRLLEYREHLLETRKAQTVNGELSAINAFLDFCGRTDCKVKLLKVQRQAFLDEGRELSEAEYRRLLSAARACGNERLYLVMETVCGTGIRISELPYITVEAARRGRAEIRLKGKNRTVILQKKLCARLIRYAKAHCIGTGHIFRTKSGRALDRSNICHDMKKLCNIAKVEPGKVFPHNLRHLFARAFYAIEKNLAHLADILGHSRIETTRIYVAVSVAAHEKILNRMGLVI